MPKLLKLIRHKKRSVKREACWILSNITEGNAEQIEAVIGNEDTIQFLIKIAEEEVPEVVLFLD